jgi:hypothetical protein
MAKTNEPIVSMILNSYFEKINIKKMISKKLNQGGITI